MLPGARHARHESLFLYIPGWFVPAAWDFWHNENVQCAMNLSKNKITFAFPKVLVPLYTRVTCPRHLENLRTLCTCQQQPPFPETCSKECLIFLLPSTTVYSAMFYQAKTTRKNPKTTFQIGIKKVEIFRFGKSTQSMQKKNWISLDFSHISEFSDCWKVSRN